MRFGFGISQHLRQELALRFHRSVQGPATALSITQEWGLHGIMEQEEPWGDMGEGTIPAPDSIAHVSEEFSGS